jgi:predicted Rossmann-fold nucleotide-binding protein
MLTPSLPYQGVWAHWKDLSYFLLGPTTHDKPIGLLNVNGFYDNLLSFLDQAAEQKFLTSLAQQIIISAATIEQLIDQLQSFIPVIDPSMSRINWSTMESRKKLRLDLSLCL